MSGLGTEAFKINQRIEPTPLYTALYDVTHVPFRGRNLTGLNTQGKTERKEEQK
jgi:hypothetical protein